MAKKLFAIICAPNDPSGLAERVHEAYENAYECREGVLFIATDNVAASVMKRLSIGSEKDELGVIVALNGSNGGFWDPALWEWFETHTED